MGLPLEPEVQAILEPAPPLPLEGLYLWEWFLELHGTRTSGGFGVNPITYTELSAWASLCQLPVSVWEIRVLRQMDSAFLSALYEAQKNKSK